MKQNDCTVVVDGSRGGGNGDVRVKALCAAAVKTRFRSWIVCAACQTNTKKKKKERKEKQPAHSRGSMLAQLKINTHHRHEQKKIIKTTIQHASPISETHGRVIGLEKLQHNNNRKPKKLTNYFAGVYV